MLKSGVDLVRVAKINRGNAQSRSSLITSRCQTLKCFWSAFKLFKWFWNSNLQMILESFNLQQFKFSAQILWFYLSLSTASFSSNERWNSTACYKVENKEASFNFSAAILCLSRLKRTPTAFLWFWVKPLTIYLIILPFSVRKIVYYGILTYKTSSSNNYFVERRADLGVPTLCFSYDILDRNSC